ncbi:hypothetical protein LPJ53_001237 [Coemansia erecta]|uniref:WD40 repeat-like protein n=1 Tax=Coemansia erecta TaxID=147472 RepID=A0A9W7Y660_9FUNG|nr:hypothetical protein LPJ53_001237 [Coemansia erecta]
MSSGSPYYSLAGQPPDAHSPRKEICNYFSPSPIYSLAWSRRDDRAQGFRMALGSFSEASSNTLQVIQLSPYHDAQHTPELADFGTVCEAPVDYPLTKVQWQPGGGPGPDLVAGSGDALRLWEVEATGEVGELGVGRGRLRVRAQMSTRADYSAPITAFDWCQADPRLIIASSIDTTCTLWDVETQQARTQLIAHDREVFDVGFVAGSPHVFASAGADGSVRMFDLRALEHSTILYEAPPDTAPATADVHAVDAARVASFVPPLLRLSCNALDPNYLATFALDSQTVSVIDVRHPGAAVVQLVGHLGPVHAVQWSPVSSTQLCSAGADARVLVWDIQQTLAARQIHLRQAGMQAAQARQLGRIAAEGSEAGSGVQAAAQAAAAQAVVQNPSSVAPSLTYAARLAVNSLAWHQTSPEWISIGFGNTVQTLRL